MRGLILALALIAFPAAADVTDQTQVAAGSQLEVTITSTTVQADLNQMVLQSIGTVEFTPDITVDGTATAEVYVRYCATFTSTPAVSCGRIVIDVDGNGSRDHVTLNGDDGRTTGDQRRWIYNAQPGFYFVLLSEGTLPGVGETATLKFKTLR